MKSNDLYKSEHYSTQQQKPKASFKDKLKAKDDQINQSTAMDLEMDLEMNFDEPQKRMRPSMAASFTEPSQEDIENAEESKVSDKRKLLMEKTNKFQLQLHQKEKEKTIPANKFARPTSNLEQLRQKNYTSSTGVEKKQYLTSSTKSR